VCDLVIRHGEGRARAGIRQLQPLLFPDAQSSFLAKEPVDVNGIVHTFDAVLTHEHGSHIARMKVVEQLADNGIYCADFIVD
jgi:hypothetical protein